MPKVNTKQLEYARQRLQRAKQDAYQQLDKNCLVFTGADQLTPRDFLKKIKRGEITLTEHAAKSDAPLTSRSAISMIFSWEPVPEKRMDLKLREKLLAEHEKKWNAIMDRAMLGDAVELLKLVQEHAS